MEQTPHPIHRIGVIGGGQLAWMMGPAAQKIGLDLVVQTPHQSDPAVAIAQSTLLAPVDDVAATAALATQCDVITFENEFIDCEGLEAIAGRGAIFRPSLDVLALVLDKRYQREFFSRIGLPNPRYNFLEGNESEAELMDKAQAIGFPLVIKTRRLGYDGYGTSVVKDASQLSSTWKNFDRAPVLLEEFVPFKQELAVMVARSSAGEVAVYPTVETQQVSQTCRRVFAPARSSPAVAASMNSVARTLVEALQLVGIVGIECFLNQDDQVLINEIAPRTHNSGHYTLDACATSQFEQQLRAVSDRPLGPVSLTCSQAVMVNLLGLEEDEAAHHQKLKALKQLPNATLYWYNKGLRPGRKLGHITQILGAETDPADAAKGIEALWYGPYSSTLSTLMPYTLDQLNAMTEAKFVAAIGPAFEDTPSIAAQVWSQRPFASVSDLHRRMADIVQAMTAEEKLTLIKAHPDLGTRVTMAEASVKEQSKAGLHNLSLEEYQQFERLNQAYKDRFDFPFILAVAGHTKASILKKLALRSRNSTVEEMATALVQIELIARSRLEIWVQDRSDPNIF
ncbi:MAG: 5-(carboxyamino)imidazole ribonucleotide synthase [Nodosilinea sp.]